MQPMLFRIFTDKGLRTFSWRMSGRIVAVSGREERERAVELCLSGMQQKQAAAELGAGTGAVHHWMRLYRAGGMAAPETGTEGRHASGRNRTRTAGRRPG